MTPEKIVGIVFLVLMIINGLYMVKQIVSIACVTDSKAPRKRFIISFIIMIILGITSIVIKHFM